MAEGEAPSGFWEAHEVKAQLAQFEGDTKQQDAPMLVAVRLRPLWQKEVDAGDYNIVSVLESKVVVVTDPWYDADLNPNRAKEKKYAFDLVFDESVGQEAVYQQTAKGLVDGVLDGYNASVFAYGATGAGKTHTMLGSLESPGVMVNTLHDLYSRMNLHQVRPVRTRSHAARSQLIHGAHARRHVPLLPDEPRAGSHRRQPDED